MCKYIYIDCMCVFVLKIRLTGWCGRRWNKLGERMAGAKKRRKMKLLTAVYRTSWSTREQKKTGIHHTQLLSIYLLKLHARHWI